MPRCTHCGGHVSAEFARVFSDSSGEVHACNGCASNAGIAEVSLERAPED